MKPKVILKEGKEFDKIDGNFELIKSPTMYSKETLEPYTRISFNIDLELLSDLSCVTDNGIEILSELLKQDFIKFLEKEN